MTYKQQLAFNIDENSSGFLVTLEPPEELERLFKKKEVLLKKIQKKELEYATLENDIEGVSREAQLAVMSSMEEGYRLTQEIHQLLDKILTEKKLSKSQKNFIYGIYEEIFGMPYASKSFEEFQEELSKKSVEEFDNTTFVDELENQSDIPVKESEHARDIRKVFLQLASKLHPDLASSEEDRSYRTTMMKEANAAYASENLAKLLELEKKVVDLKQPGSFESIDGVKLQIEKITKEVTILEKQLQLVTQSIKELKKTPPAKELARLKRSGISKDKIADSVKESFTEDIKGLKSLHHYLLEFAEDRMSWKDFQAGPANFVDEDITEEEMLMELMNTLSFELNADFSDSPRKARKGKKGK